MLNGGNQSDGRVYIKWQPGAELHYSGGGFVILQTVIEDVTGEPFADFMQREVTSPLRMTSLHWTWTPELIRKAAKKTVIMVPADGGANGRQPTGAIRREISDKETSYATQISRLSRPIKSTPPQKLKMMRLGSCFASSPKTACTARKTNPPPT